MTFQAYLDTIKAKTGKTPADFRVLAAEKGLLEPGVKTGQIVDWLKDDFDLGRGHAMAIVNALGLAKGAGLGSDDRIAGQFGGRKAPWRATFDELLSRVEAFGPVALAPTNSYISLLKGTKKFGIVQVSTDRLDVGIKLPGIEATERFEPAGSWNNMVTHRVRLAGHDELDPELLDWLRRAYEAA
ncbi:MAG: phosphoribosylformylglycinamidine synthase [Microbacteriaceae bacterium]|jgi:hypothetical protein|nr:phosphoribosylformylglycinamidine synthase [Microbacteriaceae bacterium]